MTKIAGVVLLLIGLSLIACPLFFKTNVDKIIASIPFLSKLNSLLISIAGVVLLIIGVFLVKSKTKQKGKEVPIYEGRKIVGYRKEK